MEPRRDLFPISCLSPPASTRWRAIRLAGSRSRWSTSSCSRASWWSARLRGARGAVLPAPPGLVFRTTDTLRAWMEQNYVGLAEGVSFLSGRCEARVHVRAVGHSLTPEEIEAARTEAVDAIRSLRHGAVATVT